MGAVFINPEGVKRIPLAIPKNINKRTPKSVKKTIYLLRGPGFGSGGHPTTRACLKCLEHLLQYYTPTRVLDAGAGNAILSIAAALWGVEKVIAVEVQPEAVATAKRNIILNGVQDRMLLCCADVASINDWYDVIIANLEPAHAATVGLKLERLLMAGGYFILSGLSGFERDRALMRLVTQRKLTVLEELQECGWTTFLFHKKTHHDTH